MPSASFNADAHLDFSMGTMAARLLAFGVVSGKGIEEWRRFHSTASARRRAEGLGLSIDGTALQERVNRFRYARGLVASAELEAWLEARHLDAVSLKRHFVAAVWATQCPADDDAESAGAGPDPSDFAAWLHFSGAAEDWTEAIGWRERAFAERGGAGDLRNGAGFHDDSPYTRWAIQQADVGKQIDGFTMRERVFRALGDEVATDARLGDLLMEHRLELESVVVEEMRFDTIDAAREAVACLGEDRLPIESVEARSGISAMRRRHRAWDLPEELRQRLRGARSGETLGPMEREAGFEVWRIVERCEPSLSDAGVKERLTAEFWRRRFQENGKGRRDL